ncbi:MAG: type I polyketide synthase, partial [Candidatus Omnitrophica bacterium]|nr:type I polyketide synthase [Candidatus Omnitrophota bacterium]
MSKQLLKRLESYRKKNRLSILALCRELDVHNVTYHRWKKAQNIIGPYKRIVEEFLDAKVKKPTVSLKESSSPLTSTSDIAVIGMACFYPGASNVKQLWENILARRVQFRRMLDERLPLSDYFDENPKADDKIYLPKAALIDGFSFDWSKFRIPKKTFESSDIVHWLALDTAVKTFQDAGYALDKIPLQNTGVILGNTLTGEQTRSQTLRLRWPYVKKTLQSTLSTFQFSDQEQEHFYKVMEEIYKSAFYPITEDSLAGGLANTIAGRICNYLNFKGGGYIVDGACSSSLLAVATAANALKMRDMDLVLAGGVDISLDPFELVGFSKAGALAKEQMRVYDNKAHGFIPGEGCGFVLLKRLEDALEDNNYVYAVLKGWGISSDGKGGIMEPSSLGQSMAIKRAYKEAGYSICDIDFVEGHGTGTEKGDRVEIGGVAAAMNADALSESTLNTKKNKQGLNDSSLNGRRCGITSFKSIVGHTKAAAGIGGLIKAVLAVNQRVLPPTANCQEPNQVFETDAKGLFPVLHGEVFDKDKVVRAGVSAAGFGGINCHITLQSYKEHKKAFKPELTERALFVSHQQSEVFVFAARTKERFIKIIRRFKEDLRNISEAEMTDLAAWLNQRVRPHASLKAAIVTDNPQHLFNAVCILEKELENNSIKEGNIYSPKAEDHKTLILIGQGVKSKGIGFLFPGQGSQKVNMTRKIVERFPWAKELLSSVQMPLKDYIYKPLDRNLDKEKQDAFYREISKTEITQPAVAFSSVVWSQFLSSLGVQPDAVGGHSLGELTALYQAGAFLAEELLKLAELRGSLMASQTKTTGGMVSLICPLKKAEDILQTLKGKAVIANINSPKQIVISGADKDLEDVITEAKKMNIASYRLPVSNAFHSSFMNEASKKILSEKSLAKNFKPGQSPFYSCVEGGVIKKPLALGPYLAKQIVSPVQFVKMVESISQRCDVLVEVGPGRVLSDLVKRINKDTQVPCFPVEGSVDDDRDLNVLLAQLFIRNVAIQWEGLYANRLVRPFVPVRRRSFIMNQCERPLA